jgi:AraC-like DNA-binding protein
MMQGNLSIRSYSTKPVSHSHDYHQLVLPLKGVIAISVGDFQGKVAPGECVVVKASQTHLFTAMPEARFVVADMPKLPDNLATAERCVFAINQSLWAFLQFVAKQLEQAVNSELELAMFNTFNLLLAEQIMQPKVDSRISEALLYIDSHISTPLQIKHLASIACLSPTQFKLLFKQQTGLTVMNYVTKQRMEKAQALLSHTDYPLQRISELVGYNELSSFSRSFSKYFGLSPSKFKK